MSSSSGTLPAHHSIPVRKGPCNTATRSLRINQFCTVLPAYHFGILAALMTGFMVISMPNLTVACKECVAQKVHFQGQRKTWDGVQFHSTDTQGD